VGAGGDRYPSGAYRGPPLRKGSDRRGRGGTQRGSGARPDCASSADARHG